MKFKSILSKGQVSSIFFLIVGIILLTIKSENSFSTLRTISVIMIVLSVLCFIEEIIKKRKIINPYKKNRYDSKGEKKIADYFKRKNIIFNHHPEIKIPKPFWIFAIPFVNIKLEPDFYLPEFDVYVEYWGMIEDPKYKKDSYDRKKKLYKNNGIDFISLYPQNLKNLDFVFTSKLLDLIKEREGILRKYR